MMNMRISRQWPPVWIFFNPLLAVRGIWMHQNLLRQLVRRNIQVRYKGTIIGLVWMVITPLVMLAVYTFVFSIVFKARWGTDFGDSKVAFAIIMFCGIAVFNIFAESVTSSVGVITGNPNYVKKVVFPLEILPVSAVFSAFFFGLVSLIILVAGVVLLMHKFSLAIICLPLVFIPLFLLSCGISWFVASLGVYVRDLAHVVGIVIQVLFFMTPIFYSVEMVPQSLRAILLLNPLTTIVQAARHILIYNKWPNWLWLAIVTLLSLVIFQLGYVWFMKSKKTFADVV
jgi:lipopolysaccharide transport system permease protein